ncbi:hypothetical protein WME95_41390 [Sorangium sp. So ce327]|uniref:Uncharacterized protein n=2 Tax=Sorangium TaxID=39643 RepID=A9F4W8_SORC5|nr:MULTISPECIES: hypothetical protein [Sorangium]MDC0684325.1 hypothetical protein [Sorangium aterium]CAN97750.1 hypothetical protein predicted by Glimmer/Critica [Sorangium cellulosum So ce56]
MKDIAATATLVLSFAAWVTTHVALAARLALRSQPRWRGLVALVVPPLAPMYGFRLGWRRTSTLWLVWLIVYVLALLVARA